MQHHSLIGAVQTLFGALATVVAAGGAPSAAATPPPDARAVVATGLAVPDAAFLRQAHALHALQEAAAQLALERSGDVRVRQLARRLLDDHAAARERLQALAYGRDLSLPAGTAPGAAGSFGLAGLRGVAFDRRYVATAGVLAHREALRLFGEQARDSRSTALLQFADAELPRIERHLAAAEALHAQFELRRRNFPPTDTGADR